METPFTRLVSCRHPLQQATMGGVAVPELAGAVAAAGAVGMLCEYDDAPASDRMTRALDLAAGGVVGMGFFGQWIDHDLVTFEAAAQRLAVVEVFWSTPDRALVDRARAAGDARVSWQVGSLDEALEAEQAGCDFVVAQGVEAGGHVRGNTRRDVLVQEVIERVGIPVVAAGGIASASDVAGVISLGATAARVGTRFVATLQSAAHPAYVAALLEARSGDDTVVTTTFSEGWPDAPHRVLSSAAQAAQAFAGEVVGQVVHDGIMEPVPRFAVATPTRTFAGHVEAMALYAGVGVGAVTEVVDASALVEQLVSLLGPS